MGSRHAASPRKTAPAGRPARTRLRAACAIAFGAVLALAGSALPQATPAGEPGATGLAPGLVALAGRFASMPGLSARFEEERHLELLAEPLVSRGVLYFAPPDRLLRHTEHPIESTLLLLEGELIAAGPTGVRSLPLDLHPALRSFVDTLRLLLAGELEALRQSYRIEWVPPEDPDEGEWEIRLVPLGSPLRDVVSSLRLVGRGAAVRELRLLEAGGDATVNRFSEVDVQRRFTEAELASLFRRPSP